MTLTLAFDHRILDGAQVAAFLVDLRELIENRRPPCWIVVPVRPEGRGVTLVVPQLTLAICSCRSSGVTYTMVPGRTLSSWLRATSSL